MSMTIHLEIEVERIAGKFMSKEDVAQEIIDMIDGQSLQVEDTEYEVSSVGQCEPPAPVKTPRKRMFVSEKSISDNPEVPCSPVIEVVEVDKKE